MRDFKLSKKLIRFVCFMLTLTLVLVLCSILLDPVRWGMANRIHGRDSYMVGLMAEPSDTVDVVILGDSESFTFLSPMHLWNDEGITSYIGGQSGQRIMETYYGLKRILKTQSPKVLILETNTMFNSVALMSEVNCIAHEMGYYYLPVLKYHSLWKNLVEKEPEIPKHYNGFEIRENVDPYTGGPYMIKTNEKAEKSNIVEFYMKQIKKLCDKNNIELLLVSAPSPMNHNYQKHNSIEQYALENDIAYIDLNMHIDELGIDWQTDTLDMGDHLNISGALKTTAYMENYLTENYVLEDHRGEEKYKDWDKRANEFMDNLN